MRNNNTIKQDDISELPEYGNDDTIEELEKALAAAKMRRNDQMYLQRHRNKITQAKDGRWTTNCRDESGKRVKLSSQTREDLEQKLIAFYKDVESHASITLPIICREWLDQKLEYKEISGPSYTRYLTDYNRYFKDYCHDFCHLPVREITDSNLRQFIKETIVNFDLTRKAYKQLHILLRGSLLYAKEEGYTDFSAGAFFYDLVLSDRMFSHGNKTAPELQTFSDEEAEKLIQLLWAEQDLRGLGLILMFQTGMRVGELAAIRWSEVADGEIRITATEETYKDPKTGKKICTVVDHAKTDAGERTILLPESSVKVIKAIRALNPFGEFMFMDKLGRIRAKRFNTWLHRACKKVGIPERSTHKIRKTYASVLLSSGVDEKLITSQMGHTDIAVTRDIYYYNRDSKAKNKLAISKAINF